MRESGLAVDDEGHAILDGEGHEIYVPPGGKLIKDGKTGEVYAVDKDGKRYHGSAKETVDMYDGDNLKEIIRQLQAEIQELPSAVPPRKTYIEDHNFFFETKFTI